MAKKRMNDDSLSIIQRAGVILGRLSREYYDRQDSCEKCGGTGWIEPESGDESLDIPYRCDHRTSVEIELPESKKL